MRRWLGDAPEPLSGEHAHIETLLEAVKAACDAGALAEARAASTRLAESFDRHLDREECLYFPPIAALRREHRGALDALVTAHGAIRSRCRELVAQLAAERLGEGQRTLARLRAVFADHEAEEDAFLSGLERELRGRA